MQQRSNDRRRIDPTRAATPPHRPARRRPGAHLGWLTALLLATLAVCPAWAAVSANPAVIEQYPVASTTRIQVRVNFDVQTFAGDGKLLVALPAALSGNTTVSPGQIVYGWTTGATSATTSFDLRTTQATPPGTWPVTVSDPLHGSAQVKLIVKAPGFRTQLVPSKLRLEIGGADAVFAVHTDADPGLDDVAYRTEGFPPFLHFGGSSVATAPGFQLLEISAALRSGAKAGVYRGRLRGTSPGAESVVVPLTVEVVAAPEPGPRFTASLSSERLRLRIGEGSEVRVRTEAGPGLGDVSYRAEGFPPFLDFGSGVTSAAPAFRDVGLRVSVAPTSAAPSSVAGTYAGRIRGRAAGAADVLLPLIVEVSEPVPPRLSATLSSDRLEIVAGDGGAQLTIRTEATPSVGDVRYRAEGFPPFLGFDGKRVSTSPRYRRVALRVTAAAGAPPGTYSGVVRGSAAAGSVDLPLTVRVIGPEVPSAPVVPAPVVEVLRPTSVARGTLGQRFEIAGRHFAPGARLVVDHPDVRIDDQRIVSDRRIVGSLSVRSGDSAATARFRVVGPDGSASSGPAILRLYGGLDLSAPLTVRTAAILFPRAGTLVARGDDLRPRGMLATTGSGTVIGSWLLDGVPFDRFTVHAVGGEPVEVTARSAIPPTRLGEGRLELVIESPQRLTTRPISIVQVTSRPDRLRLLTPLDGQAIHPASVPTFRWTPVPGAAGYLVELRSGDEPIGREIPVAGTSWRPGPDLLSRLAPGELGWRVRARGGVGDGQEDDDGIDDGDVVGSGRFVLLPSQVRLSLLPPDTDPDSGRTRVRWSSGAEGVLYRVDVYLGGSEPAHSGLTFDEEYALPDGLAAGAARLVVTGLAPGGVEIGTVSADVTLASSPRPAVWRPGTGSGLRLAASGGAILDTDELFLDSAGGSDPGVAESAEWPLDWQVDLEGTVSGQTSDGLEGTESDAYLALSTSVNEVGRGRSLQVSGDLSARWESDAGQLDAGDNRNWLARGAVGGLALSAGSLAPSYLVDSEVLSAGSPTGAFELGFTRGRFAAGYHETTAEAMGYAGPSVLGGLDARSVALVYGEAGLGPRLSLLGVESRRPADDFFAGAEADVLGLAADWHMESGLRLTAEAAWSDSAALGLEGPAGDGFASDGFDGASQGGAYRLSAARAGSSLSYGIDLFYTDSGFENPADEGFQRGGRPGVAHGELRLGRTWSTGSAELSYQHLENAGDTDDLVAATRQNVLELSLSWRPSPRFGVEVGGDAGTLIADADADLFLPGSDQESWAWRVSASAVLGGWTVLPEMSVRESEDRLDVDRRSETSQAGLAVSGSIGRSFRLSSRVSAIRDRSGAGLAETESTLLSLEPTWTFDGLGLAVRPYFGYDRIDDDFSPRPLETETFRLLVSWDRDWLRSAASFELGGDWRRSRGGYLPSETFVARYTASVTLRWNWRSEPRSPSGRGVGVQAPGTAAYAPPAPMSPTA